MWRFLKDIFLIILKFDVESRRDAFCGCDTWFGLVGQDCKQYGWAWYVQMVNFSVCTLICFVASIKILLVILSVANPKKTTSIVSGGSGRSAIHAGGSSKTNSKLGTLRDGPITANQTTRNDLITDKHGSMKITTTKNDPNTTMMVTLFQSLLVLESTMPSRAPPFKPPNRLTLNLIWKGTNVYSRTP